MIILAANFKWRARNKIFMTMTYNTMTTATNKPQQT